MPSTAGWCLVRQIATAWPTNEVALEFASCQSPRTQRICSARIIVQIDTALARLLFTKRCTTCTLRTSLILICRPSSASCSLGRCLCVGCPLAVCWGGGWHCCEVLYPWSYFLSCSKVCVVGALSGMWCLQNIITFIRKILASAERRSAPAAPEYFDYLATRNDEQNPAAEAALASRIQQWSDSNLLFKVSRASIGNACNSCYVSDHNVSNCCSNTWHFQWCCETWEDPDRCTSSTKDD